MLKKSLPHYRKNVTFINKFYCPALLSAAILILAFPPFEQGYLAWVALLPLITIILRTTPARSFKTGLLFGLVLNLYVNFYINQVLFTYLSGPLALLAMILLAFYTSLFYGLFALSSNLVQRLKCPLLTAMAVPILWMLFEFSRSIGFLGYNVGYLGYTQWQYSELLNLSATYGYWGLPFLIVFIQTILVMSLEKKIRDKELAVVSSVFMLILICGLFVPSLMKTEQSEETLKTNLIQGNSSMDQILRSRTEVAQLYLGLTESSTTPGTDLVVWPETVLDINASEKHFHNPELTKIADNLDLNILYGARLRDNGNLYNIITLYESGNHSEPVYKKVRLVPFVEFFPAEDLLNELLQLDLLLGSYAPGGEITLFDISGKTLAGVICFESYFGKHTRLFAREGAEHLFVLTNDAWFGRSIGLDHHAQAAAIRAAEMGIGVTQVANSGITISFDYRGREIYRSAKQKKETIPLVLDMTVRQTPYTLLGDYFPLLWAIYLALAILFKKYFKPA